MENNKNIKTIIANGKKFIKDECYYEEHSLFVKATKKHLKSFSTIAGPVLPSFLSEVPDYILKKAAEKGKAIHEAIEQTLESGIDMPPEDKYLGWWKGFQQFMTQNKVEMLATELRVFDIDKSVSGIIDFLGIVNEKLVIIDWKTSIKVNTWFSGLQLFMYKEMLKWYGIQVEELYICHLTENGKYKMIKINESFYELYEKVYESLLFVYDFKSLVDEK